MIDPFFDDISDGICVSDDSGAILYMNPAAERMLDLSIAKAGGRPLCEVLCGRLATGSRPECASDCPLRTPDGARAVTFEGKHGSDTCYRWSDARVERRSRKNDLRVRCLKTGADFLGEGRHLTIIEDRSAQAESQRQLEEWRHMVAHDLRVPLTSLYAVVRLQQEAAEGKTEPPSKELVDVSVRSCDRMLELLNLYLDLAKIDAGAMRPKIEKVRVEPLVRRAAESNLALAERRKVSLRQTADPALWALADASLLQRALDNLVNNAVKFCREGGAVELGAQAEAGQILLKVKDEGPGIAAEDLPRLFDRYFQAEARRAGKLQGTGLGLSFCREAARLMDGSIEVASRPGRGSEFTLRLPQADFKKA